jgi:hypothetical protein
VIGNAVSQRILGSDNNKVDSILMAEAGHLFVTLRTQIKRDIPNRIGNAFSSRIARRHENSAHRRALGDSPSKRVLSAAGSDD